jgi:molecular chaperone DnaK
LIKDGRDAVEKQDDTRVTRILENLEKEAHAMASKLYENVGGSGPNGTPPSEGPPTPGAGGDRAKGDVIDAEFEETGGS